MISLMSVPQLSSGVLSFADARRVVEAQAATVRAPEAESVDLLSAAGRALAEAVLADRDLPPFRRSTRDGYAVRSADLSSPPATLDVIGEIKAGEKPDRIPTQVASGQAVEISFSLLTLPKAHVRGTVTWKNPGNKAFGVRFDNTDERRLKIKEWIDAYIEG